MRQLSHSRKAGIIRPQVGVLLKPSGDSIRGREANEIVLALKAEMKVNVFALSRSTSSSSDLLRPLKPNCLKIKSTAAALQLTTGNPLWARRR
jgi:hypothetical protein